MDSELKQGIATGCIVGLILVGIQSIFKSILQLIWPDPTERY